MVAWYLTLVFGLGLGLVSGAALREERSVPSEPEEDENKPGMVDDYEFNVAINCREYPAFGVLDPRTCSQMKQGGELNYNPVVGNNWNTEGCPTGWATNQGKCYKIVTAPKTLDIAAGDCGAQGSQLVAIHNMETNLFVKNILANSPAASIFLGAKSDAPNSMRWMVGINSGDQPVTTDFSNMGQTFETNVRSVSAGKCVTMTKGSDEWDIIDCQAVNPLQPAPERAYVCQKDQPSSNVGFCRWDAFRANTDVKSACMCPTSMTICSKRANCYWYEDPNSPFKECISNSERFYNMLHRLLVRRGKKDFALNIRYGSTPARGQMPFGPYGPSIIGAGNPNPTSMFGVYGHKNPYDRQRGMGIFGQRGHYAPQRQSNQNPWGQSLPGRSQFGYGRGPYGQGPPQPWGQRQQVYHEGNRFNPHRQQNHRQY